MFIKEEYVDIPNVFVATDSEACAEKIILGGQNELELSYLL